VVVIKKRQEEQVADRSDYTGREALRLRQVHAEELRARQGQIGLVNEAPIEEEPDVVYGMDGEPVAAEDLVDVVEVPEDDAPLHDLNGNPIEDRSVGPRRRLQRRRQVEEVPALVLAGEPEPRTEYVVMRVAADIEQMTYGAGTSYDFLRGRRYSVPKDLYQHLEARGLVQR
jgi:hypothetical protein